MQLSVFSPILAQMKLDEALAYLKSLKVDALELGVGGYPGTAHASATELAADQKKLKALKSLLDDSGMRLSALSVHSNGVHPNAAVAARATEEFEAACAIASTLGVDRIVTFSGCPGDGKGDQPNWVTCAWPNEYADVLAYQWNDVLIPYWNKEAAVAQDHGVKVCFEMHPGFCVYNPTTMLRLRDAVGDTLGANFDPSHLVWQGIDCAEAVRALGEAIYFVHAKDTAILDPVKRIKGVLDTTPFTKEAERSWIFRTVGYGHDTLWWKDFIGALRLVGYDHAISIEHEDSLMTPKEGLEKAVAFMHSVMIREGKNTDVFWA